MIKIYSKQGCSQCITAENLCKIKKVDYKVLKLGKDYKLEDLQALTGKLRMSMPVIALPDNTITDLQGFAASIKR